MATSILTSPTLLRVAPWVVCSCMGLTACGQKPAAPPPAVSKKTPEAPHISKQSTTQTKTAVGINGKGRVPTEGVQANPTNGANVFVPPEVVINPQEILKVERQQDAITQAKAHVTQVLAKRASQGAASDHDMVAHDQAQNKYMQAVMAHQQAVAAKAAWDQQQTEVANIKASTQLTTEQKKATLKAMGPIAASAPQVPKEPVLILPPMAKPLPLDPSAVGRLDVLIAELRGTKDEGKKAAIIQEIGQLADKLPTEALKVAQDYILADGGTSNQGPPQ